MSLRILSLLLLACSLVACPAPAANLLPNSSFEIGSGRGWFTYGTADSTFVNERAPIQALLTNSAVHGVYGVMLPTGTRLISRPLYLTAGAYRLTGSIRTMSGIQGSYYGNIVSGAELDLQPGTLGNFTGTFGRFTNTFSAGSNGIYFVKIMNSTQPQIIVDALQVETGTVATAYAPMATVEMALSIPSTNNMWFEGDTPVFTHQFWNEGAQASVRNYYQVFDGWNSNLASGYVSATLEAAGSTFVTTTLPQRKGWMRITSRGVTAEVGGNDTYDEVATVVYPYSSNVTIHATNNWLGGHPTGGAYPVQRELLANRKWARLLSPMYRATRWEIVEPTRGAFDFTDADAALTNYLADRMNVIGPLVGTDGQWNSWATNTSATTNVLFPRIGMWDGMAYSNYCWTVVNRYKTWVHYWEVWNEPYQSGPYTNLTGTPFGVQSTDGQPFTGTNLPINIRVHTNYARVLFYGIEGIRNADPTAKIVAMAGAYGSGDWAFTVWTNAAMANSTQYVTHISTHIYAQTDDPNQPDPGDFSLPYGWVDFFRNIRPVWNTESGLYNAVNSNYKGWNGLWPGISTVNGTALGSYDLRLNVGVDEALRNVKHASQRMGMMRYLAMALRCVGYGFSKFFVYDSRPMNDAGFWNTQPYPADAISVDRPENVVLSVAQHMIVAPGFGRVTNAAAPVVILEMYAHTNSAGNPVITVWNQDRTNRTFTCLNPFFEVIDCMGNQVQSNSVTFVSRCMPQYIRSTVMNLTELSNNLAFASVVGSIDDLPPQTSIDIAPSGLWNGATNHQLFKWTAMDDKWVAWPTNLTSSFPPSDASPMSTNVLYKWKLDGGAYSSYTQSNYVWIPNLAYGNHKFYVTSKDYNNNAQEWVYEFVPPTSTLYVHTNAFIGVITQP